MSTNTCNCAAGYSGLACELSVCFSKLSNESDACGGHGTCETPNLCGCEDGYSGKECQIIRTCYGVVFTDEKVCGGQGNCTADNECTFREATGPESAVAAISTVVMVVGSAFMLVFAIHPRDGGFYLLQFVTFLFKKLKKRPPVAVKGADNNVPTATTTTTNTHSCNVCGKDEVRYSVVVPPYPEGSNQFEVCSNEYCFNTMNDAHNSDELKRIESIFDHVTELYLNEEEMQQFVEYRQRIKSLVDTTKAPQESTDLVSAAKQPAFAPIASIKLITRRMRRKRSKKSKLVASKLDVTDSLQSQSVLADSNYLRHPSSGNVKDQIVPDVESQAGSFPRLSNSCLVIPNIHEEDMFIESNIAMLEAELPNTNTSDIDSIVGKAQSSDEFTIDESE